VAVRSLPVALLVTVRPLVAEWSSPVERVALVVTWLADVAALAPLRDEEMAAASAR